MIYSEVIADKSDPWGKDIILMSNHVKK